MAPAEQVSWMDRYERTEGLIVNLNALFVFARAGQSLPEVCAHVTAATKARAFEGGTVWYPRPLAYAYFLSRAYSDGAAPCLADAASAVAAYVLARQGPGGGWDDDLDTAMALITLMNAGFRGPELSRGIRTSAGRQGRDGGWTMGALYKGAVWQSGSRELTTGFALEALGKFGGCPSACPGAPLRARRRP